MIKTAVNTFIALEESAYNQYAVAIKAILKIMIVKRLLIAFVSVVKPSSLFLLNTSLLHNCVK